jgi:hypothetical protein
MPTILAVISMLASVVVEQVARCTYRKTSNSSALATRLTERGRSKSAQIVHTENIQSYQKMTLEQLICIHLYVRVFARPCTYIRMAETNMSREHGNVTKRQN